MIDLMNYPKRADTMSMVKIRGLTNEKALRMNYRQSCSGKFVKPPYGAFEKSNGTERYGQSACNQL